MKKLKRCLWPQEILVRLASKRQESLLSHLITLFISDLDASNIDQVKAFCISRKVDLVVIGPEKQICDGWANELEKTCPVFAPSKGRYFLNKFELTLLFRCVTAGGQQELRQTFHGTERIADS